MKSDQVSARLWPVFAFLVAGIAVWLAFPGAFGTIASPANDHRVVFITNIVTKPDCMKEADAYLGRMAVAGTLPTGRVVRWSEVRKLCFMALTYTERKAGKTVHTAAIVDLSYPRPIFSVSTAGAIDPQSLLQYDGDLDRTDIAERTTAYLPKYTTNAGGV
jgi:hypothetical protein